MGIEHGILIDRGSSGRPAVVTMPVHPHREQEMRYCPQRGAGYGKSVWQVNWNGWPFETSISTPFGYFGSGAHFASRWLSIHSTVRFSLFIEFLVSSEMTRAISRAAKYPGKPAELVAKKMACHVVEPCPRAMARICSRVKPHKRAWPIAASSRSYAVIGLSSSCVCAAHRKGEFAPILLLRGRS